MYYYYIGDFMNNERGYRLIFILKDKDKEESFILLESNNIEEIDSFTMNFNDLNDIKDSLNQAHNQNLNIIGAYIERIGGKNKKYEVLYKDDSFNIDKVIKKYTEYVLSHPKYFYNSPARHVKLEYVDQCLNAYFKDKNYRKIRGAYVELKELGEVSRVLDNNKGRIK